LLRLASRALPWTTCRGGEEHAESDESESGESAGEHLTRWYRRESP
jgi:hypothetical protein